MERNKLSIHATTWMNLYDYAERKIQTVNNYIHHVFILITYGIENVPIMTQYRLVLPRGVRVEGLEGVIRRVLEKLLTLQMLHYLYCTVFKVYALVKSQQTL